jgi:hypothetical protein
MQLRLAASASMDLGVIFKPLRSNPLPILVD